MGAKLEIDEDLFAAAEQVAARQGQTLSAFAEQALRKTRALGPKDLTVRELEILKLVCQGLDNREIAIRLSLMPGTVKAFLGKIYAKLNAGGRAGAVASATEAGWLSPPRLSSQDRQRVELPTFGGRGLRPGVNLDDSAALLALMESQHAPG